MRIQITAITASNYGVSVVCQAMNGLFIQSISFQPQNSGHYSCCYYSFFFSRKDLRTKKFKVI